MARSIKVLLLLPVAVLASAGIAHGQARVTLGSADSFAVLAGAGVANAGPTTVDGDLGVSPGAVSGFPPGIVNGTTHSADAVAAQAQLDLAAAYGDAAGRAVTATIPTQLGGTTLPPGAYESDSGAFDVAGTLTLDAQRDGNAVFIFKVATTLDIAAAAGQIKLIKSAQACNVFWQVGGSATLGAGTGFSGNVLAVADVMAGSGATVDGRLLSRTGTVSLENDSITASHCDKRKPKVKVTNVPSRCTRASFRARFKVSDLLGVSTNVLLDGRRIKRSRKNFFTARIGVSRLAPGPHTIRMVTRDDAGNKQVKSSRFVRCARSAVPSITG